MKEVNISIPYTFWGNSELIYAALAKEAGITIKEISSATLIRKSLDARSKPIFHLRYSIQLKEASNQTHLPGKPPAFIIRDLSKAEQHALIIGTGPAGLFAALQLIERGIRPILIERGKAVQERRHDLAQLMKHGKLDPESNYCFGEGGAGTFSDGKLYTRSKKRGPVSRVIELLHFFGADDSITYEAHPHIGSNKLPMLVQKIRNSIIECGGEVHFNTKLLDFHYDSTGLKYIKTSQGRFETKHCILATGHSARDIFHLFSNKKLSLQQKPFALGVRIEFPQALINTLQYRQYAGSDILPPASFSFVCQAENRGVYTFCMCPGGIICPATTEADAVVVNGWSPSKRNSYFANSGFVVEVSEEDLNALEFKNIKVPTALRALKFQQEVEQRCAIAGGGEFRAPAQRISDFLFGNTSSTLPKTSYSRGTTTANISELFPPGILEKLKFALTALIVKHPSLNCEEAVMLACESRTSSPVQIPRLPTGEHPEVKGLYPCGEGAGYAGGILSAALDGMKTADNLAIAASSLTK